VVTIDIRRGVTRLDEQLLRWLEPREIPVAVLLTKADKLSRGAAVEQERAVARELGPGVKLVRFSSSTGEGVAQAQAGIEGWLQDVG
jgi:GTP-binding protein